MRNHPDAKIIAMINDLSTEGLAGLMCFYPGSEIKLRDFIRDEYIAGRLEASVIVDQWEADNA